MNAMFDTVVRHDAAFDVPRVPHRPHRTTSRRSCPMRVTSKTPGGADRGARGTACRSGAASPTPKTRTSWPADRDGCAPEDFYSTTNHQTSVRLDGQWVPVEHQRMDAAIVVDGSPRDAAGSSREIRAGDSIVCGIHGIKIVPEFQERDRHGFAFMTNEISSERRVEVGVSRIAAMMRAARQAGDRIAFVAGPVVVHTGGGQLFLRSHPPRLRGRAARRQRARRARRGAGALRHVARRRHGERPRDRGRPPPPHARHQRHLPRRRPARGGRAQAC